MRPRSSRQQQGQVLVEFAIVLPLLLLLFYVLVDFGDLMMHHISVQTVLREGARVAVEHRGNDEQVLEAMMTASSLAPLKRQEISISRAPVQDANLGPLTRVTLKVNHPHEYIIPYLMDGKPGTLVAAEMTTYLKGAP